MDAFVFVREASESIVRDLQGLVPDPETPVHYVTPLSGRFDALLVLEVDSLSRLQEYVLETIHGETQLSTETAIALTPGPLRIKRQAPAPVECFVRIRVERGKAEAVLKATSSLAGYHGSAIVAAEFDVLLELGGDTFDDVKATLLQMHQIAGIVSSTSSFAATG